MLVCMFFCVCVRERDHNEAETEVEDSTARSRLSSFTRPPGVVKVLPPPQSVWAHRYDRGEW